MKLIFGLLALIAAIGGFVFYLENQGAKVIKAEDKAAHATAVTSAVITTVAAKESSERQGAKTSAATIASISRVSQAIKDMDTAYETKGDVAPPAPALDVSSLFKPLNGLAADARRAAEDVDRASRASEG